MSKLQKSGSDLRRKGKKRKKKKKNLYKRIVDSAFQILTFSSPEK